MNAPERNAEIVRLYRAGRKQAEIARQFGMSQSRVSRVIYEAMQRARLKQVSSSGGLPACHSAETQQPS